MDDIKGVSSNKVTDAAAFLDDINEKLEKGTITLNALMGLGRLVFTMFKREKDGETPLSLQAKADLIYEAGVRIEQRGRDWFDRNPDFDPATGERRA